MAYLHTDWARQLSSGLSLLLVLGSGGMEKLVFGDRRKRNYDHSTCEDLSIVYVLFFHVSYQYATILWKT